MLCGLPESAIKKLRQVSAKDKRITQVWLYGSRAVGREKPASDIDLCVEAPTLQPADLYLLESRIDNLSLPWKIDLSLKHQIDNPALIAHIESFAIDFLKGVSIVKT